VRISRQVSFTKPQRALFALARALTPHPAVQPGNKQICVKSGLVSGTPEAVSEEAMYTVTATNRIGSIEGSIKLVVVETPDKEMADSWSIDQVQVWLVQDLKLKKREDRLSLVDLNGAALLQLTSLEASFFGSEGKGKKLPEQIQILVVRGVEDLNRRVSACQCC